MAGASTINRSSPENGETARPRNDNTTSRPPGSVGRGSLFFESGLAQSLGLVGGPQLLHEGIDLTVEHAGDVAQAEVDAVIRDAILREVVGPDLLRSLPAPDLRTPGVTPLLRQP